MTARYERFDVGTEEQKERTESLLKRHGVYKVVKIDMGQSITSVYLKGYKNPFNSVFFDFYDDDGNKVDIYKDPRYNSYLAAAQIRRNVL